MVNPCQLQEYHSNKRMISTCLTFKKYPTKDPIDTPKEHPVESTGKAVYEKPFTFILIHEELLLPQG